MSTSTLLSVFLLEAAVFGVWIAIGFPSFGPQRLSTALGAVVLAFMGLWIAPAAIHVAAANPVALRVVLSTVLVPILAGLFWTGSCFVRALVRTLSPLSSGI